MAPPRQEFGITGAARRWWVVLVLLLVASALVYLRRAPSDDSIEPSRFGGATMGTTYSVVLGEPQAPAAREALEVAVRELLTSINTSMSTYDPESELSRFNRHASTEPVRISAELAEVVRMALEVSRASEGAFDVTVGPLVEAWGFGPSARPSAALSDERLASLRERVGYEKLELQGEQLRKLHPELHVDLSAIAKGYAVDRVAELLQQRGHPRYLVEIGGELRGRGKNTRGVPFRVGIEVPRVEGRSVHTAIRLDAGGMATSGNYRNYYELGGERFVHTIDPKSGRPVAHRLASATVLHARCALADAWATALMVAGAERAYELARASNLDVLLLIADGQGGFFERTTPGFEARRIAREGRVGLGSEARTHQKEKR